MTEAPDEWDNRLCGRITKAGKRCRAHAELDPNGDGFETIGCYLHDSRRRTHRQEHEAESARRVHTHPAHTQPPAGGVGRNPDVCVKLE
jgi:hypothetical protein